MIFIDAREGVSADMLLAAMIGLMNAEEKRTFLAKMAKAGETVGLKTQLMMIEDRGDTGLGLHHFGDIQDALGRTRDEVLAMLSRMRSSSGTQESEWNGFKIVEELFNAEAIAHATTADEVHLHEAGRPGALLNIFGIGTAHAMLGASGAGEFVCSTITTGKGIAVIGHGAVRIPAPACSNLLRGLRHTSGSDPGERATPTGLAAIRAIVSGQSDQFPVSFRIRSVGFGTRRFGGRLGRMTLYWP